MYESKFQVGDTVTIKQPKSIYKGEQMVITEVDETDERWPYFCEEQGDSDKFDWFKNEHLELSKKDPWNDLTDDEKEDIVESLEFHLEACESQEYVEYSKRLKKLINKLKEQ